MVKEKMLVRRFPAKQVANGSSMPDRFGYGLVAPLSLLTIRLETFTGSKSAKVRLVRHERSPSFQRASGVPISPPLSPLSARMIP